MRVLLSILPAWAVLALSANAVDLVTGPVDAQVLRVVDGDTLAVRALIWPGQNVEVKVRLAGVDAPEWYRPKCAHEKDLARSANAVARDFGDKITLHNIRFGKYAGRVVADVRRKDGSDLGKLLQEAGLGVADNQRKNWCAFQAPPGGGVLSVNRQ